MKQSRGFKGVNAAGGLRLFAPAPPASPILGALKQKPSGIPIAAVSRPWCGGQFRFFFFRRRAGPRHSGEVRSEPQATSRRDADAVIAGGND